MGRQVRWAVTYSGKIHGTGYVFCSEDEHRPEKLAMDDIDWDTSSIEIIEVVDSEIIDGWDEA